MMVFRHSDKQAHFANDAINPNFVLLAGLQHQVKYCLAISLGKTKQEKGRVEVPLSNTATAIL